MCNINLVANFNLIISLYLTCVRKCLSGRERILIDTIFDVILNEVSKVSNNEFNVLFKNNINMSVTINNIDKEIALYASITIYKIYHNELYKYLLGQNDIKDIYDFDEFFEYFLSVIYTIYYEEEEENQYV